MPRKMIQVRNVGKTFSTVRAVDRVSFDVEEGQNFALLGPNGAGKSTLVRMIIGMLPPDEGEIQWLDDDQPSTVPLASKIGYLPEDRGLYRDQKVRRILEYFGRLRGMTRHGAREATDEWSERLEVSQYLNDKLETLSKGNQQKVQVAAAVLHRPRVALLDEPFSGLDPLNQEMMVGVIRHLRESGTTVVLSAHQLELVERLADQVFLLAKGKCVLAGTVSDLKESEHGGYTLQVRFAEPPSSDTMQQWLRDPEVRGVERMEDGGVLFTLPRASAATDWLVRASQAGELTSFRGGHLSLYEIYLRALNFTNPSQAIEEIQR